MKTTKIMSEAFGLSEDGTIVGESPRARRDAVRANPRRRAAALEAHRMLDAAWAGDRVATMKVNEAITTSDLFRDAVGQVMDVEMVQAYQTVTPQWDKIAKRTTTRNFKPKTLRSLLGTNYSLPKVPEHTPYPVAPGITREDSQIRVAKFGERYGYTLEARINDEIGELQETPAQWADIARRTEDDALLDLLANPVTGAPNTAVFTGGKLGTGALNATNLEAALNNLVVKRDTSGRLLVAPTLQLVVGPALQFTAQRVLDTTEVEITMPDGTKVRQPNPFRGRVTLTVMPNLPGTAWFILPVPTSPKPAFHVGFLAGYETPDLRQKADQGTSISGSAIAANEGSFDDDTIWFRCRHVVGAAAGDTTFAYASDGLGA